MIHRLCIIGVGLIGGSLARDLRRLGLAREIVGHSRRVENLRRAVELRVIDRFEVDAARAVDGADVVVIAAPLGAMTELFSRLAGSLSDGAVLTDVGSAKRSVLRAAEAAFGEVPREFVPGHPIAGTEHSGVQASVEGLFSGKRVILTPCARTSADATARVTAMWRAVGAQVVEMDPDHHDEVLAATSHLPHMLAYALMEMLGGMPERVEIFRYAAGGLRDFTRIASSDPQMWHDICLANRDAMVATLERFHRELCAITEAVRGARSEALWESFARAKRMRDRYIAEADVESRGEPGDA